MFLVSTFVENAAIIRFLNSNQTSNDGNFNLTFIIKLYKSGSVFKVTI